jgi:hypothetical protein
MHAQGHQNQVFFTLFPYNKTGMHEAGCAFEAIMTS